MKQISKKLRYTYRDRLKIVKATQAKSKFFMPVIILNVYIYSHLSMSVDVEPGDTEGQLL